MADVADDNPSAPEDAEDRDGETPATDETPKPGDVQEPLEQAEPGGPDDAGDADAGGREEEPHDRAEDHDGESGEHHGPDYDQGEDYGGPGSDVDSEEYDHGEYDEDHNYEDEYAYEQDHDQDEYDDEEYEEYEEEEEEEEEDEEDGQRKMTLVEHLEELRTRIIRAAIGLAAGMGLALIFTRYVIELLSRPFLRVVAQYGGKDGLVTPDLTDPFMMYLKMALYLGIIASSPWLFYQAWMFVAAGLYRHERRYVKIAVPFCTGLFISGAAFFLFVIAPFIVEFFYVFATDTEWLLGVKLRVLLNIKNHITFMTNLMLVFGLCFQMPVAVFLLGKMGLVTVRMLNRYRKYVIVVIFIIAAFCTSPSPLDQIALAIPMWLLYELGVLLVYLFVEKKRREEEEAEEAEEAEEYEEEEDQGDEEDEEETDEEEEAGEQAGPADDEEYDDVEPMH
ncbi:MAG: twin-arginine translocase subunit TatC [Phycisphaerae bacterium]